MLPLLLLPVVMADSFWITAELLRVDWKEGCLTTAGCSQPRFEVIEDMLPLKEKTSISWPISEQFVQDVSRPFVSYWTNGKPEDLIIASQVVGTDPTYGFPRVCDRTVPFRAFRDEIIEETGGKSHQQSTATAPVLSEEDLGKKLIEIRAKCFNATVAVQKHTERCPWCPDPSNMALIEQRPPEDFSALSTSLRTDYKILQLSMLVLAGIAVLTSLGFALVLVAFLGQKWAHRQIPESRYHPFSPSTCKTSLHENRYDMPWEQISPLTYSLTFSSKATTTPPLDPASSSVVAPCRIQSRRTMPQTHLYYQFSSKSSTDQKHSSGLDSA